MIAALLLLTALYAEEQRKITKEVRERFNLPDHDVETCTVHFPYGNNLANQFTDFYHYRHVYLPGCEWSGYTLRRIGDNLWEGTNEGQHYVTTFDARPMTMQIRISNDNEQDHLECKFESDSNCLGKNTTQLSWDHQDTDGYWNFVTGHHPEAMWLRMDGVPENGYWETSPTSDILNVSGKFCPNFFHKSASTEKGTFRMKITY